MGKDDCRRFEQALAEELQLDEVSARHAEGCLFCRALVQAAGLYAAPMAADKSDPFVRAVHARAALVARRRAARHNRRRFLIPFLIGLAGYLSGAATFLPTYGAGGQAVYPPSALMPPALPPPGPAMIASVMVCAAVWVTVVALLARGRSFTAASASS